jgi:hypothetical protein
MPEGPSETRTSEVRPAVKNAGSSPPVTGFRTAGPCIRSRKLGEVLRSSSTRVSRYPSISMTEPSTGSTSFMNPSPGCARHQRSPFRSGGNVPVGKPTEGSLK